MLLTCQAGFEPLLVRELSELHGVVSAEQEPGWVRLEAGEASGGRPGEVAPFESLAFAHLTLLAPVELQGDSVNGLAARVAEFFLERLGDERIEAAWPNVWLGVSERVGLGRRIGAVAAAFEERLKKKLSRVSRLAVPELPRGACAITMRGLFVFFADFGRVFAAREAFVHGPRRMADDDLAPSRSYLKVEEAYNILGREPQPGETVCDLGAAPGGWSYSAAKRGARVVAIDNGPLKMGALDHPLIAHRREDAFRYLPVLAASLSGEAPPDLRFDWLFCDLVEEPHHVLHHIVEPWLARGGCRRFIVNLKFGRVEPIALLRELQAAASPLMVHAPGSRIRHLYHDREELTVVGTAAPR